MGKSFFLSCKSRVSLSISKHIIKSLNLCWSGLMQRLQQTLSLIWGCLNGYFCQHFLPKKLLFTVYKQNPIKSLIKKCWEAAGSRVASFYSLIQWSAVVCIECRHSLPVCHAEPFQLPGRLNDEQTSCAAAKNPGCKYLPTKWNDFTSGCVSVTLSNYKCMWLLKFLGNSVEWIIARGFECSSVHVSLGFPAKSLLH